MKHRNRRFGCRHIAQQLSYIFGIDIDKDVVRRVLAAHYRPKPGFQGPSWLSFLGHTKDSLWSVDLFRSESLFLQTHWVMVVMDQFTRRIIGFTVHAGNVDGPAVCRMFNEIVGGQDALPVCMSSDHDPLFQFRQWCANLRILEVTELKTVPYVPLSHPFVERLIGTIRRELLDHVLYWTAADLERKLTRFQRYYNRHRIHASLAGVTPESKAGNPTSPIANLSDYRWRSHCRNLYQLPTAA
jgi:transposase InsO family protein